jgi:hypothetical protein
VKTPQSVTAINTQLCARSLPPVAQRSISAPMVKNPVEETTTFQALARVTTAAVVVAAALLFAVPFLLALLAPFVGR